MLHNEDTFEDFKDICRSNVKESLSEGDNSYIIQLMQLAKIRVFGIPIQLNQTVSWLGEMLQTIGGPCSIQLVLNNMQKK